MRKLILLENPCPTFQAYLSGTAGRAGRSHGTPTPPPRPPTVGQKLYTVLYIYPVNWGYLTLVNS